MAQRVILQQLMPSLKSMVDLPTLNMYLVSKQIINYDQVKKLTVSETCNKCEIILKLVEILCQYKDCAQLLLSIMEEINDKGDGTVATEELITILKESIENPPSPRRESPWDSPDNRGMRRRPVRRRRMCSKGSPSGYESSQSLESISEARGANPFFGRTQSDMAINHPQDYSTRMESQHERKLVISNPSIPLSRHLAEQSQLVFSPASVCVLSTHASPIDEEAVMFSKPIQCTGHTDGTPAIECKRCTELASQTYGLMVATDKITTYYAKFVLKTKQLIEARSSLQDVLLFFFQKYSPNVPGGSFFPDVAKIKESTSFHDLMDKLGPYMSWFEYGPIALLCQTFGGEDGDTLVADYESKLREYLKNCVHECQLISQDYPPQDYDMFSVKLAWNWDETNYHRVENFKRTLASILKSNPQSFFLKQIKKGCVLLTFLAPIEMCNELERLALEFPQALVVHDVMGVIVGDRKTVIQQTLLKFSWTNDSQAGLSRRSDAVLPTMQSKSGAMLSSADFKNLPHYFPTQDDMENSFMSQIETSQVWEFVLGGPDPSAVLLGSDLPTSGSEFPTSGSEDYPQTLPSTGESQKSSSSYSTSKESQNEFDHSDTHLQMPRKVRDTDTFSIRSMDRSPERSDYIFAKYKHGHMQATTTKSSSRDAYQSTDTSCNPSGDHSMYKDPALSLDTIEGMSPTKKGKLMSERPPSMSRARTSPLLSNPNKLKEQLFASELSHSLTKCQQEQWSGNEDDDNSCPNEEAMLDTEQELASSQSSKKKGQPGSPIRAIQAEVVESVPSQASKPASNVSEANGPPISDKIGHEVSSVESSCELETAPSGPPLANHQAGITSQSSLRRYVLTHASSVNSLLSQPAKRNSLDSGYIDSDSKRSSYALSNCSTPESASPRGSFSSNHQSPTHMARPRSFMAQRERMISPLAHQEETFSSGAGDDPGISPLKPTFVETKTTSKKAHPIRDDLLLLENVADREPEEKGENKSESHTRERVCEVDREAMQQMISAGNVCQNKRVRKREMAFRRKFSQQASMLNKRCAVEPVNVVISSSPAASIDATNTGVHPKESISTVLPLSTNSPLKTKADVVQSIVRCSSPKVKLLCRPLQSRRKSCEIIADEGSESSTVAERDKKGEVNSQEGELSAKPTNLGSDPNKQELDADRVEEHKTMAITEACASKLDKKKPAACRSSSTGIDICMLATLGEEDVAGTYPSLARQYSTDTTSYESESTLCSTSLDHSCFSTLDQNDARVGPGRIYESVSMRSSVSCRSTASGRSDPGYQTDQESFTPVTTPVFCASSMPPCHLHRDYKHQQTELDNIVEHAGLMSPTEMGKGLENALPDGGYGTYKSDAIKQ